MAGCDPVSLNDQVVIKTNPVYAISSVGGKRCGEGTVTLVVEGGSADGTYRWYEALDATVPIADQNNTQFVTPTLKKSKTYYASSVTAIGCESERIPVYAEVINLDPVTITAHESVLTSSYSTGNQWFFNGELIPGATDQSIEVTETGLYAVEVVVHSCTARAAKEMIVLGIEDLRGNGFDFYPNPVSDKLQITLPDAHAATGYIQSLHGKYVAAIRFEPTENNTKAEVDFTDLSPGLYFISIFQENKIVNYKIIKQ
jgi:hypothetical protein